MPRFVVGTGQRCPTTTHSKIEKAAARVNYLVNLGYQQILIEDKDSGWKCIANDVVTVQQLVEALHTNEIPITHLLKRRAQYSEREKQYQQRRYLQRKQSKGYTNEQTQ